ncbi:DMT family transporter [Parapusillimonas sp. SGNA-6]|nr:DMT family transporter [Parapusillimonas sp. SGNA-6]
MTPSTNVQDFSGNREFWAGFMLAAVGAVLFAAKVIVVKLTYRYGVDALTVIGFRMMLSLPFFAGIALAQARQARLGKLPTLTVKESLQIAFLGFIGYYMSSYLDFLGLQYISAGLERLILFLAPTFVLLISAFYFKRRISRGQWVALALSYFGVVCVFFEDLSLGGPNVMLGSGLVLGAAVLYAFYLIGSGELIKRVGATRLTAYAMSVSVFVSMLHFFSVHGLAGLDQPLPVYGLGLIHAVVNTVMPTFMIMWAVARIGAPMTAQLGLLGPTSVLFLAAWLLGEPITTLQLIGTAIALAGVMVLGRQRR